MLSPGASLRTLPGGAELKFVNLSLHRPRLPAKLQVQCAKLKFTGAVTHPVYRPEAEAMPIVVPKKSVTGEPCSW